MLHFNANKDLYITYPEDTRYYYGGSCSTSHVSLINYSQTAPYIHRVFAPHVYWPQNSPSTHFLSARNATVVEVT